MWADGIAISIFTCSTPIFSISTLLKVARLWQIKVLVKEQLVKSCLKGKGG